MLGVRLIVMLGLLAAGGGQGFAQVGSDCVKGSSVSAASMDAHDNIASTEHPAQIVPTAGPSLLSRSPALRITLRPTAADPDAPFLAQVFATSVCNAKDRGREELLGVVSFFPLKLGQAQEFVLPAPQYGFPAVALQNIRLTVKLIPANPARSLDLASVEVDGAQFVD
jgi:hypothetical protein